MPTIKTFTPPPITFPERLEAGAILLVVAALIFGVGWVLLNAIGKKSPARRRHGKFVLAWVLAGWLVGAAVGVSLLDGSRYVRGEADAGLAGFGLLVGWAVGTVHGGLVLALRPREPA